MLRLCNSRDGLCHLCGARLRVQNFHQIDVIGLGARPNSVGIVLRIRRRRNPELDLHSMSSGKSRLDLLLDRKHFLWGCCVDGIVDRSGPTSAISNGIVSVVILHHAFVVGLRFADERIIRKGTYGAGMYTGG